VNNLKHQFGVRSESGVYQDSLIDPSAEVYGSPRIIKSKIGGGRIFDRAELVEVTTAGKPLIAGDSTIYRSFVGGLAVITGEVFVSKSLINDEAVITDKALVEDSEVLDKATVSQTAIVKNSIISGNAVITGNANVHGYKDELKIGGWNYIHRGTWFRPPVHKVAPLSGFTINECTEGHVDIGCICNRPEKFLRAGYRYMNLLGFTNEQTDEIKDLLSDLLKEVKQNKDKRYENLFSRGDFRTDV
jgi:carbonic anhydrase/acetyltransferase-like protein (isoleucine patch superfamily)